MILETIAEAGDTLEKSAAKMAGNYKSWRGYCFMGTDIPRYNTLMIGCIVNNERTLGQLVNLEAIRSDLTPYLGNMMEGFTATIYNQDFCGDKDLLIEIAVQVYDEDGQVTPAFRVVYDIARKLKKSYNGIIDEKLYKIVNRRELSNYVKGGLPYICEELNMVFSSKFVDDVVSVLIEDNINYDDVSVEEIRAIVEKHF